MNIINAIYNLVNYQETNVISYYTGKNRANNSGDALEEYIKDLFAGSFKLREKERMEKRSNVFSYFGNNSNPPDAMLKNGDAIETKKIGTFSSSLALNSSYPKQKLFRDSLMISKACREAEEWDEKDMIYAVGVVNGKKLRHLSMVYGRDYCASEECYSRIKTKIKNSVESIPDIDFTESRELGHINRVDPLGITYMRVRGMWGIENPWKAFNYVYEIKKDASFDFMCIINEEKWNSFENLDLITSINVNNFSIEDIKIKNPDNPAKLVNAKLISYFW